MTSSAIVVGDHIRIENQVRTVVKVATTVLYVDRPFEEIDTSDITKIFPQYTPVEVIADMGGVRSSCTVTDLRQLTSTEEICRYAPGTDRDVRACGHFTANQAAASGRDDQKMREINPAHNIATSNKDTNIVKSDALTVNGKVVTSVPTAALVGVKIGMAAFFKIKNSAAAGSFVSVGRVTAVGSGTFTLDTTIPTAYATSAWIAADAT